MNFIKWIMSNDKGKSIILYQQISSDNLVAKKKAFDKLQQMPEFISLVIKEIDKSPAPESVDHLIELVEHFPNEQFMETFVKITAIRKKWLLETNQKLYCVLQKEQSPIKPWVIQALIENPQKESIPHLVRAAKNDNSIEELVLLALKKMDASLELVRYLKQESACENIVMKMLETLLPQRTASVQQDKMLVIELLDIVQNNADLRYSSLKILNQMGPKVKPVVDMIPSNYHKNVSPTREDKEKLQTTITQVDNEQIDSGDTAFSFDQIYISQTDWDGYEAVKDSNNNSDTVTIYFSRSEEMHIYELVFLGVTKYKLPNYDDINWYVDGLQVEKLDNSSNRYTIEFNDYNDEDPDFDIDVFVIAAELKIRERLFPKFNRYK
ncbi:hypothetical protein [Candidatus Uabimicrobium sp. HlEnr_7]|uniref:hypothetical protein n=1 Tax=Candidatus Uabimicrobium helgolandensis TaxID=3095367 RepID=UPI00355863E5